MKKMYVDAIMSFLNNETEEEDLNFGFRLMGKEDQAEFLETYNKLIASVYDADESSAFKLKSHKFLFSTYEDKILKEREQRAKEEAENEEMRLFLEKGAANSGQGRALVLALYRAGSEPIEEINERAENIILAEKLFKTYDRENWKELWHILDE